jgi:hypothetical protein
MKLLKKSYANSIKSLPLKIEKISIRKWLTYYGLDDYYEYCFETMGEPVAQMPASPFKSTWPEYKHKKLLQSIKTNVDLLKSFIDGQHFEDIIREPLIRKIKDAEQNGLLSQNNIMNSEIVITKFVDSFNLLKKQALQYKALNGVLGLNPTKKNYDKLIDTSPMLDFVYDEIDKQLIKRKLKLLTYDDLLHIKIEDLNQILKMDIDLLQHFDDVTKTNKIKKGLTDTMINHKFNEFISDSLIINDFYSVHNELHPTKIKQNIIHKYDVKQFLKVHRINLIHDLIKPISPMFPPPPSPVTDTNAYKIYNYIFPDDDTIFKNKQFEILKQIPNSPKIDDFIKNNKVRVFYIQAHGMQCSISNYQTQKRVNFDKIFANIKPINYDKKNIQVIANQSIGRFSYVNYIRLFNDLFMSKNKNEFIRGILTAYKEKHYELINQLFTFLVYIKEIRIDKNIPIEIDYSTQLKELKLMTKIHALQVSNNLKQSIKYHKFDFSKYTHVNPPSNSQLGFVTNNMDEELLGIFELLPKNTSLFDKMATRIQKTRSMNYKVKMGLGFNWNRVGITNTNRDEILKYNKIIGKMEKKWFLLDELISLIYTHGDIKKDEYVVIFNNQCRSILSPEKFTYDVQNTMITINKEAQKDLIKLRHNSVERGLNFNPYDDDNRLNPYNADNESIVNDFNESVNNVKGRSFNNVTRESVNNVKGFVSTNVNRESVNDFNEFVVNNVNRESVNDFNESVVNNVNRESVNDFNESVVNNVNRDYVNDFNESVVNKMYKKPKKTKVVVKREQQIKKYKQTKIKNKKDAYRKKKQSKLDKKKKTI